ncbi:rhodanese-like domain-containing protein [Nonlabens ponticola]|uniref:Rhodanese-like domain-containing protein n=1 Tax=Nonlabens ponticola TaxID=2496866 RepID=A0A3S9N064_9FLAO|nr:rhodanese-like domain-containing protein [Nonlabens ponticola]AZQ44935.1 rhodanese-like domain-containing protein [Nonlabens ponticola]
MSNIIRAVLAIAFIIALVSCSKDAATVTQISVEEAETLIELDDVQLIDVRSAVQYDKKRLDGAINIDVEDERFNRLLENMDKDEPVLLYCNQGNKSARCSQILEDRGFTKIYDIDGGLAKWEASGRKVIVKEIE